MCTLLSKDSRKGTKLYDLVSIFEQHPSSVSLRVRSPSLKSEASDCTSLYSNLDFFNIACPCFRLTWLLGSFCARFEGLLSICCDKSFCASLSKLFILSILILFLRLLRCDWLFISSAPPSRNSKPTDLDFYSSELRSWMMFFGDCLSKEDIKY